MAEILGENGVGHYYYPMAIISSVLLLILLPRRRKIFVIPAILMGLVIINPWFKDLWLNKLDLPYYYRILWLVPVIPLCAALPSAISEKIKNPNIKGLIALACAGIFALAGSLVYKYEKNRFEPATNAEKIPENVKQIADRILELDDNPRIIIQYPLGNYIRQYSGSINTLFGRDIDGFIMQPGTIAYNVNNIINFNQNNQFSKVNRLMLDDGFDFLIMTERLTDNQFQSIDTSNGYGIYTPVGIPSIEKYRNEFGQVICTTLLDENGNPTNGIDGYSTVAYEYDHNGYVSREIYTDTDGTLVEDGYGAVGYSWVHDAKGRVLIKRFLGKNGKTTVSSLGYAELKREYNEDEVIKESFHDADGKLTDCIYGYAIRKQQYDETKRLTSRRFLSIDGQPVNRTDGYSLVRWETNEETGTYDVVFYDKDGQKVSTDGINLAKDIPGDAVRWSEWMKPSYDTVNSCLDIGVFNLGEKQAGDVYTCQIEIEFYNVKASENKAFAFWTQGAQDGRWDAGNIWGPQLACLTEPPQDGIYYFSSTVSISEQMIPISVFNIGFRCDNWANGMFRVRNIKIEKGNSPSKWSPGI